MFGIEIFWQKNIGEKSARTMLVKSTTGVNFFNVKRMRFLHLLAIS